MSSLFGFGGPVCLLAVLWAAVLCGAVRDPPSADLEASLSGALALLWTYVGRTVESAVEPLVTGLDRHESGHDELITRLDNHSAQLAQLSAHNTQLSSRLDSQDAQLDGLATQLAQLIVRMDNQFSHIDGLATLLPQLLAQNIQLSGRLDNQGAQLDGLATQLAQLSAHNTQLDSQDAQLDGLATQLAQLSGRLDSVQESLPTAPVRDCSDLPDGTASGVHLLQPGLRQPVPAYCDLDTDGGNWTVVQRRADIQPRQDFYLGWQDYKWGLGVLTGEFWWGLEHLWGTTALLDRRYELRVDMEDFDGEKRHALYQGFRVSPEADGYRLTVANYSGDAGDSLSGHSGFRFSTKEKDQDISSSHCAQLYKGGWWFENCHWANLNGLYLSGEHESYADGVNWHAWKGYHYSFKTVVMKIRPSQKL